MKPGFLVRFVDRVLAVLEREGEIELVEGARDAVVTDVAARLGTAGEGQQVVSALSKALVAHQGVVELFADDARLYELMAQLGSDWMRG